MEDATSPDLQLEEEHEQEEGLPCVIELQLLQTEDNNDPFHVVHTTPFSYIFTPQPCGPLHDFQSLPVLKRLQNRTVYDGFSRAFLTI